MRFLILFVLVCLATPTTASASTPNRVTVLHNLVRERTVLIDEIKDIEVEEQDQILCLALNIYHESRGENDRSRWAVGFVTLNRVKSSKFSNSVCGVVWARSQFSWTVRSASSLVPRETAAWSDAQRKGYLLYSEQYTDDPTAGADHFYAARIRPSWSSRLLNKLRIGAHMFARSP